MIAPSQGVHLVVDASFLPGNTAIMIPKTDDGRVLFAVPWHGRIVLGTTDTPVDVALPEPIPLPQEIDFILRHAGRYLTKDPELSDIKSMFAGLRPLVKGKAKKTAALSRDHLISVGNSGLITITGGKWTTYRKMAEDVINTAVGLKKLEEKECVTKLLQLTGHESSPMHPMSLDVDDIRKAVQEEMCLTVEDYLSRRTRHLLLDANSAIASATFVAKEMASLLNHSPAWEQQQITEFTSLAKNYLPSIN